MVQQPLVGQGLLIIVASRSHSDAPHTRHDSSGRVISPTQRPLPDNTQHSQETDIHVSGGIRTRNPSKLAAADQRLRLRCHWERYGLIIITQISKGKLAYMNEIKTTKWSISFSSDIYGTVLSFFDTHRNELHTVSASNPCWCSAVHTAAHGGVSVFSFLRL